MLTERARRLAGSIGMVQERAASVGRAQALATAAEKLSEKLQELGALEAWRRTLKPGASAEMPSTMTRAAATAVRAYRERIAQSQAAAADPTAILQVVNQLKYAVSEQRSALERAWEEHVRTQAPVLNMAVLSVLRDIPSLKQRAMGLERCLQKVDAWRQGLPDSPAAVTQFDRAVEEAKATWQNLGGNDLGPDVAKFLQSAATGVAPLDALTPAISEWLKQHGIWAAFRITLARDTSVRIR